MFVGIDVSPLQPVYLVMAQQLLLTLVGPFASAESDHMEVRVFSKDEMLATGQSTFRFVKIMSNSHIRKPSDTDIGNKGLSISGDGIL